jgi:hypothetical protein
MTYTILYCSHDLFACIASYVRGVSVINPTMYGNGHRPPGNNIAERPLPHLIPRAAFNLAYLLQVHASAASACVGDCVGDSAAEAIATRLLVGAFRWP